MGDGYSLHLYRPTPGGLWHYQVTAPGPNQYKVSPVGEATFRVGALFRAHVMARRHKRTGAWTPDYTVTR